MPPKKTGTRGRRDGPMPVLKPKKPAAAAAAAVPSDRQTRAQKRAQEAFERLSPEEKADLERQKKEAEDEKERLRQKEKTLQAEEQEADLPGPEDPDDVDAYYRRRDAKIAAEGAARDKAAKEKADAEKAAQELADAENESEPDTTKGPTKLKLIVTKRLQEAEIARLERWLRIAQGEPVSPLSSSGGSSSSSSSSSEDSEGDVGNGKNPGPPPRDRRFLCGVGGCSSGAYGYAELNRHYKTVHKGRGMPKRENDVQTADFLDWLNDRIEGYPATKPAKKQYASWIGSRAKKSSRKRTLDETESDSEESDSQSSSSKRPRRVGKGKKRAPWRDEELEEAKRLQRLIARGKGPLGPTQGGKFVEEAHLTEMQKIRDEQHDQIWRLRRSLRTKKVQVELARRDSDYARYSLLRARDRARALKKIASINNISLPEAEDKHEYQKLLLEQAFGEEESQRRLKFQSHEWELLQRRAYHIYRRERQSNEEWVDEERRVNLWKEGGSMSKDTDHRAEGSDADQEEVRPRPVRATARNNPDDDVSATGFVRQTERGRHLTYTQRRNLRELATLERILPRANVDLDPPANPDAPNRLEEPAQDDQPEDQNQPGQDEQQQGTDQPVENNQRQQQNQPAQGQQKSWFRAPKIRSETGEWTCVVM